MTTGLHTVNLANKWLSVLNNTTFTAITTCYVKLHTADPGSAGTTAPSAETDRKAITWNAAASGSMTMNGTLSWTAWDAGTETISHISIWDNSTAGNVLWTGQLSSNKTVNNGDTLNITAITAALTPLMA